MCGVCDGDGCPYCGCYVISSTPKLNTADQLRQAKVEVLREAAARWSRTNKLDSPLHLLSVMTDEIEAGDTATEGHNV